MVVMANTSLKTDLDLKEGNKQTRLTGTLAMQIRPAPPPAPKNVDPGEPLEPESNVEAGAKLVAEWSGKWLPVKVLEPSSSGDVKVHWEGYADSFDEELPRSRLRYPKK
jgi:hypothetical protein